jgi:broad specificity phosphatase PhoE
VIVLVRHAESAVDQTTNSNTWGLTPKGMDDAARIELPPGLRLASGPEPKLRQTLEPHGPVRVDERFRESDNPDAWLGRDAFLQAVHDYFNDEPHAGWEPRTSVVDRFREALEDGMAVCTGGRALSTVVAARTGVDPWPLWQTLTMPDVRILTLEGPWVASNA